MPCRLMEMILFYFPRHSCVIYSRRKRRTGIGFIVCWSEWSSVFREVERWHSFSFRRVVEQMMIFLAFLPFRIHVNSLHPLFMSSFLLTSSSVLYFLISNWEDLTKQRIIKHISFFTPVTIGFIVIRKLRGLCKCKSSSVNTILVGLYYFPSVGAW